MRKIRSKKILSAALCTAVLVSCVALPLPAPADDPAAAKKNACMVPVAAASMATGAVVGTPIAILRKTGSQYVDCVKDYSKDTNSYKFWGAVYSVPVAMAAGLIKGTVYGAKNAIGHSINRPFSKDAFSMGGDLEGTPSAKPAARPDKSQPYLDRPESQPWGTPK